MSIGIYIFANRIKHFPFELSLPLTKIIISCFPANAFRFGSLFETCPQIVLFT